MNFDRDPERKDNDFPEGNRSAEERESLKRIMIQTMVALDSYDSDPENTEDAMDLAEDLGNLIAQCKEEIVPKLALLKGDPSVAAFGRSMAKARKDLIRFLKKAQELHLQTMSQDQGNFELKHRHTAELSASQKEGLRKKILDMIEKLRSHYDEKRRFLTTNATLTNLNDILEDCYYIYQPQIELLRSPALKGKFMMTVALAEEYLLKGIRKMKTVKNIANWDPDHITYLKSLYNKLGEDLLPKVEKRGRSDTASEVKEVMTHIEIGMADHKIDFPERKKGKERADEKEEEPEE